MKTTIKIVLLIFLMLVIWVPASYSQDFIRIGATHDFQKGKVVQTFSFDFNRTEKIDEKKGRFLLFDRNNFYLLPTFDVNLGEGVTSSENNVLSQINFGKAFYGDLKKNKNGLTTSVWNKSIELNPSYNSDNNFKERLVFGQLKFLLNYVSQTFTGNFDDAYIKFVHSFSSGIFYNNGHRYSKNYAKGDYYSTIGLILDYKTRILDKKNEENWIFKASGNYYNIVSEVDELTSDNFAGSLKLSIDKRIWKILYLSATYKYGTDNPNYKTVHTFELAGKVKF